MTVGRIPNVEGGIQPTLLTTTGDIIYASSASNPARLGIGSSAQVLTVAAGVPSWATPSSGGMTSLASGSLSGTAVNLSSISGSYKELVLYVHNIYVDVATRLYLRFNSDTAANYAVSDTNSQTTTVGADSGSNWIPVYVAENMPTTSGENTFVLTIPNYTNTAGYKPYSFISWNKTATAKSRFGGGIWKSASAITAINFNTFSGTANFSGTYTLYGVN